MPAAQSSTNEGTRSDLPRARRNMKEGNSVCNIVWFRRGLRVQHDNPVFEKALLDGLPIICIYILAPSQLPGGSLVAGARPSARGVCTYGLGFRYFKFLFEAIEDLKKQLQGLGLDLLFFRQATEEMAFRALFNHVTVKNVFCDQDLEPYGMKRDDEIRRLCETQNVKLCSLANRTIYDPLAVLGNDRVLPSAVEPFLNFVQGWSLAAGGNAIPECCYDDVSTAIAATVGSTQALEDATQGIYLRLKSSLNAELNMKTEEIPSLGSLGVEAFDPALSYFTLQVSGNVDRLGFRFTRGEITSIVSGSWAEKAGLEIDDEIRNIGGADFESLSYDQIVEKMYL